MSRSGDIPRESTLLYDGANAMRLFGRTESTAVSFGRRGIIELRADIGIKGNPLNGNAASAIFCFDHAGLRTRK